MKEELIKKLEAVHTMLLECASESSKFYPVGESFDISNALYEVSDTVADAKNATEKFELIGRPMGYIPRIGLPNLFYYDRRLTEITAEDTRTGEKHTVTGEMFGDECILAAGFCIGQVKSENPLLDFDKDLIKVTMTILKEKK